MRYDYVKYLLIFLLFSFSLFIRLKNLGYSDYIPDETTVLSPVKNENLSLDFFLSQRKGPMQWLVAKIPFLITNDVFNSAAMRFPFAVFNFLAVVFFFNFVREETKSFYIAFLSAALFSINGLIFAFSRVVQYQNLNLFFSVTSLFFFAKFRNSSKPAFSYFGTLFLAFSFLSHWDAVFVLPYVFYTFFKSKNRRTIFINLLIFSVLFFPYLLLFFKFFTGSVATQEYFSSRLGIFPNVVVTVEHVIFKSILYNPFFFLEFCIIGIAFSIIFIKVSRFFLIWFLSVVLFFLLFIKSPGTHIYNIYLPIFILCSISIVGLSTAITNIKLFTIPVFTTLSFIFIGFFAYQTYLLFIDHSTEYPWVRERVYKFVTRQYDHQTLTNNIIGFPYYRDWSGTRSYLLEYENTKDYSYVTNDNKSIANFYLNFNYGISSKMFVIGVKNPSTFVSDYKFSQIKNKHTIKIIEGPNDQTLARIYEVNCEKYAD